MLIPTPSFAEQIAELQVKLKDGTLTNAAFKTEAETLYVAFFGEGTTDVQAIARMSTYLSETRTRDQEFHNWATGAIDGGPNGDGLYPITTENGASLSFPCIAKIMDPLVGSEAVAVAAAALAEQALADVQAYDSTAAQAALAAQQAQLAAEAARDAAQLSKAAAALSESAAGGFATDADASAIAAEASRVAAAAARTAADASKVAAQLSETEATAKAAAAELAKIAAQAARDAAVIAKTAAEVAKSDLVAARDAAAASAAAALASESASQAAQSTAESAKNAAQAAKVAAEAAQDGSESAEETASNRAIAAETAQAAAEAALAAALAAKVAAEAARDAAEAIAGMDPDDFIRSILLGVANGVAQLGPDGKILPSQMAAMGLQFQGTWDASANTPAIPAADETNAGHVYIVSVDGATALDGKTDWRVGDWVMSMAGEWYKLDQTNLVSSVNGMIGAVVLTVAHLGIAGLSTVQAPLQGTIKIKSGNGTEVAGLKGATGGTISLLNGAGQPVLMVQPTGKASLFDSAQVQSDIITSSQKATSTQAIVGTDNDTYLTPKSGSDAINDAMAKHVKFRPTHVVATGVSQTVTLPHAVEPADLLITVNGMIQLPTDGFVFSGANVTFTRDAGDKMEFILPGGVRGQGLEPDARGTLAGRDAFNGEAVGFCYLDIGTLNFWSRSATGWNGPFPYTGPAGQDGVDGQDGADAVLTQATITAGLTYTPANKAGDAFTGPVSFSALPKVASKELGFRTIPQRMITGSTTLTLADSGGHIAHNETVAGTVITIPGDVAFEVGTTIAIMNFPFGTPISVVKGTGVQLWLSGITGTNDINRTIAPNSMVTMTMIADKVWMIAGSGLT